MFCKCEQAVFRLKWYVNNTYFLLRFNKNWHCSRLANYIARFAIDLTTFMFACTNNLILLALYFFTQVNSFISSTNAPMDLKTRQMFITYRIYNRTRTKNWPRQKHDQTDLDGTGTAQNGLMTFPAISQNPHPYYVVRETNRNNAFLLR